MAVPVSASAETPVLSVERDRNIERLHREAVERRDRAFGPDSPVAASAKRDLGLFLLARGRAGEASGYLREALESRQRDDGAEPIEVARDAFALAQALRRMGDAARSEALCDRAARALRDSSARDPGLEFEVRLLLAELAADRSDLGLAARRFEAAVAVRPDPDALLQLSAALEGLNEYRSAEGALLRALALRKAAGARPHPQTGEILHRLALLAGESGDLERARQLAAEAQQAFKQSSGANTQAAAAAADTYGNVLRAAGDLDAAARVLGDALELRVRLLGPSHPEVAATMNNLAGTHHVAGRPDRAEPLYRRALGILEGQFGTGDVRVAQTLFNLGYLLLDAGRSGEAAGAFVRTLEILAELGDDTGALAEDARRALAAAEGR